MDGAALRDLAALDRSTAIDTDVPRGAAGGSGGRLAHVDSLGHARRGRLTYPSGANGEPTWVG